MKIILVGHPGSQKIVPITKHLIKKYLPNGYEVIFLSYDGEIGGWSLFCRKYLETLEDEGVIFGLDDYLISEPICSGLAFNKDWNCHKLCACPDDGWQTEWTCTTQWSVWERDVLIDILRKTSTPWDFEINGTKLFNDRGYNCYGFKDPAIQYADESSLSNRHPGKINVRGLCDEDIQEVLKYYDEDDLIIGMPEGEVEKWKKS